MTQRNKRRTDERRPVNSESFFLTSAIIDKDDAGKETVLFSFPKGNYQIVAAPIVEIIEDFDGGATLDIGAGTIPTDNSGEGTVVTVVDADEYVTQADITEGTIGLYGASASDTAVALGAGKAVIIKGAAVDTPVVYATLGAGATKGKARVHMLVVRLPTAA